VAVAQCRYKIRVDGYGASSFVNLHTSSSRGKHLIRVDVDNMINSDRISSDLPRCRNFFSQHYIDYSAVIQTSSWQRIGVCVRAKQKDHTSLPN